MDGRRWGDDARVRLTNIDAPGGSTHLTNHESLANFPRVSPIYRNQETPTPRQLCNKRIPLLQHDSPIDIIEDPSLLRPGQQGCSNMTAAFGQASSTAPHYFTWSFHGWWSIIGGTGGCLDKENTGEGVRRNGRRNGIIW
jgi:hypothetical protein